MKEPQRTCVVCKETGNKKTLLRIVKTADGEILTDTTGKKNGRGAYLCKNPDCFLKLKKTKGLDRSFKMPVSAAVYDRLLEEVTLLKEG